MHRNFGLIFNLFLLCILLGISIVTPLSCVDFKEMNEWMNRNWYKLQICLVQLTVLGIEYGYMLIIHRAKVPNKAISHSARDLCNRSFTNETWTVVVYKAHNWILLLCYWHNHKPLSSLHRIQDCQHCSQGCSGAGKKKTSGGTPLRQIFSSRNGAPVNIVHHQLVL